jgi:hypothetical protein
MVIISGLILEINSYLGIRVVGAIRLIAVNAFLGAGGIGHNLRFGTWIQLFTNTIFSQFPLRRHDA